MRKVSLNRREIARGFEWIKNRQNRSYAKSFRTFFLENPKFGKNEHWYYGTLVLETKIKLSCKIMLSEVQKTAGQSLGPRDPVSFVQTFFLLEDAVEDLT